MSKGFVLPVSSHFPNSRDFVFPPVSKFVSYLRDFVVFFLFLAEGWPGPCRITFFFNAMAPEWNGMAEHHLSSTNFSLSNLTPLVFSPLTLNGVADTGGGGQVSSKELSHHLTQDCFIIRAQPMVIHHPHQHSHRQYNNHHLNHHRNCIVDVVRILSFTNWIISSTSQLPNPHALLFHALLRPCFELSSPVSGSVSLFPTFPPLFRPLILPCFWLLLPPDYQLEQTPELLVTNCTSLFSTDISYKSYSITWW